MIPVRREQRGEMSLKDVCILEEWSTGNCYQSLLRLTNLCQILAELYALDSGHDVGAGWSRLKQRDMMGWGRGLFLIYFFWLLSIPATCIMCFRDRSESFTYCHIEIEVADQTKLILSEWPTRSVLMQGHLFLVLTLYCQASGCVATTVPVFKVTVITALIWIMGFSPAGGYLSYWAI